MANWFCNTGGRQIGPISDEMLQQMVQSGQIRSSDMVWREGMPNWVAANVMFNFPNDPPAPPPQPQGYPAQPAYYTGPQQGCDWLTTLLLCIFVGGLGIHRFYTGHTAIGIIQLVTLGGCGIWTIIDLILIASGSYRDSEGRPLIKR